ncbi:MAG: DNA repair protein RadA [Clostridia bacterium]|nr:DNA repair protein RadA [Clostridia bacterium]MDD4376241.1 DNA repair protein RadA [Clostridia bacterium]
MSKEKTIFFCKECGHESVKWLGKCPGCNNWNTFVEEKIKTKQSRGITSSNIREKQQVKKLSEIKNMEGTRLDTGYEELNRVLGGGLVEGSLILLGGEPGIGKSTLVLQICDNLTKHGNILYVSGEESDVQIKMRADRLNINGDKILFLAETDITEIEKRVDDINPKFCVIDSIQTMYDDAISSVPGSVSQVREVTARLMNIAKSRGISTIVVGHVTKDGTIAGPRLLEHMVDVVLYIEGERFLSHRIIRGVKNRFGSTNEIGIFEMKQEGLVEVKNMSELFIVKDEENTAGTVSTAIVEGTSTLVLEIQALTTHSYYNMPRRVANGIDFNRLNMIIAVIEKICNINLGTQDIYVNVVGGLKITETAADVAIALAIISSYKNIKMDKDIIFLGEIALNGQIRNIINIEKRIKEVEKIGYKRVYAPKKQLENIRDKYDIELIKINEVQKLMEMMLDGR